MASTPGPEQHSETSRRSPRWWRRMLVAARRANIYMWLEIVAALSLAVMFATSYIALTQAPDPRKLVPSAQAAAMLIGTLIPALTLVVLFGRRLVIRRAGGTTARLHVNLVFFFSLVAAIPTLLVAVFASFLFQAGMAFWFSDDSRGILVNANELAEGYYHENQRDVANETTFMVADLRENLREAPMTSSVFADNYAFQAVYRGLSESAILRLQPDGTLRVQAIVDPDEDM